MRYHFEFGPAIQEGMLFKDFSYLALDAILFSQAKLLKQFFKTAL